MRLISPHPRYSIQLIESPVKRGPDQSGAIVEYQDTKPIIAEFRQMGLLEWEQIAALQHFSFSGLPEGVNPLSTVSCWDSEVVARDLQWTDELHQKVQDRARHLAQMNPASVLVVEKPKVPAPWPSYDAQDVEQILATLKVTQLDPQLCRLYEADHQNREDVIALFEALLDGSSLDDLISEFGNEDISKPLEAASTPIVSGVASDIDMAPAKVDPLAKARAAKAAKAAAKKSTEVTEGVTVDA